MTTFDRVIEHYHEALNYFSEDRITGIFLQGSQNYGLDLMTSDVDTKLIVIPTFKDIAMNKKPVSTTHIRDNEEHIDFKDVRLYMETFRKQNLNFLEILFTNYKIINPLYEKEWDKLIAAREKIARMNPYRAVKSMKGIAMEKYHAMEHPYPSKLQLIEDHGYDPKQVSHLVRVRDYLDRYIHGESYSNCLHPSKDFFNLILDLKKGKYSLKDARMIAQENIQYVEEISNYFCSHNKDEENNEMREILEDVQYNIMKIAVQQELG